MVSILKQFKFLFVSQNISWLPKLFVEEMYKQINNNQTIPKA